eukprot:359904-Prymnesium_polylepis.1
MDGLVGGKAKEADGLAESRRSGAVGVRWSSVRAGQGPARGREAHASWLALGWIVRKRLGPCASPHAELTCFP